MIQSAIQNVAHSKQGGRRSTMPTPTPTEPRPLSAPITAPAELDNDVAIELVQCFKLLADETRLRILYYLMQRKEMHVRAFCNLLNQSQPAVSHHLALLRVAGFIDSRRDGKHNFYHLAPKHFHQILSKVFAAGTPEGSLRIFEDYVLSYVKTDK